MNTCECGCGEAVGQGRKYVNNAHKQRAFRSRKRNQSRVVSRYAGEQIWRMFGEEKAMQIYNHLNGIFGAKQQAEVSKAITIMLSDIERKWVKNG